LWRVSTGKRILIVYQTRKTTSIQGGDFVIVPGIIWCIGDYFSNKWRKDFSQILAKAGKKTYIISVSLCRYLVELVGIEPTTS